MRETRHGAIKRQVLIIVFLMQPAKPLALLGGFLFIALASTAAACCGVGPVGKTVAFGDQTNIIVWDAAAQTEHFVRNATFTSAAKDFGFIAPTPSKPNLSEASKEAFITLAGLKPPKEEPHVGSIAAGVSRAMTKSVRVVQQVDVGGYQATTLLASDADALAGWMKKNGYATTPGIVEWTKFYIAKGWYLTAFKVENPSDVASTGTIRMSFHTDRPFNPFFVPSDNLVSGRTGTLRLYFVSNGDYDAHVGESTGWQTAEWQAPVSDDVSGLLAAQLKLPPSAIPANSTVASYVDTNFPREASDDLYFSPARQGYVLPAVVLAAAVIVGAGLVRLRRVVS
jgi:hypothetical protein